MAYHCARTRTHTYDTYTHPGRIHTNARSCARIPSYTPEPKHTHSTCTHMQRHMHICPSCTCAHACVEQRHPHTNTHIHTCTCTCTCTCAITRDDHRLHTKESASSNRRKGYNTRARTHTHTCTCAITHDHRPHTKESAGSNLRKGYNAVRELNVKEGWSGFTASVRGGELAMLPVGALQVWVQLWVWVRVCWPAVLNAPCHYHCHCRCR